MKIRMFLLGISLCSILLYSSSCFKKDSEIDFSVKNPAKGLINGKQWQFMSGIILKTDLFGEITYDLVLIDTLDNSLCDKNYRKNDRLLLELPTIGIGKYTFDQIKSDEDFYGLSFMDSDVHKNIFDAGFVAHEGTIEIIDVNREEGLLTGFIEATGDDKNIVKGNFKVRFCQ